MRAQLFKHQSGQGLVEYALIIMFVVIVVVAILGLMGPAIGNMYSQINNGFS
ncbi:MAG: pilus assembly protein [Chloroflexi bacterium]|nr:pilus assembly protein [Chloroflexota bacterium]